MNRRMKQIEDRLEQYLNEAKTNKAILKAMDSKVEEICVEPKKKDKKIEKQVKQGELNVYEEMRERETKRLIVVFFKMPKLNDRNATAKDKLEWDKKTYCSVFFCTGCGLGREVHQILLKGRRKEGGALPSGDRVLDGDGEGHVAQESQKAGEDSF
jgi:hypothetical protein